MHNRPGDLQGAKADPVEGADSTVDAKPTRQMG